MRWRCLRLIPGRTRRIVQPPDDTWAVVPERRSGDSVLWSADLSDRFVDVLR